MSYTGPTRTSGPRQGPAANRDADWQQVALFGSGLALGILLGAGIALLTATQSGEETREVIRQRAQHTTRTLGRRSRSAWRDLRDELRAASGSLSRRQARRSAARRRQLAAQSEIGAAV